MKTMTESVLTSYENEWDVMPAGRLKTFHSVGAICPIKINIKSSPFTGLLKTGQIEGLIRLGPAMDFTEGCGGMMPGGAMKFLRTNVTSGNTVFLNGLNPLPDGNHDFMSVPLSNHAGDDIKRISTNMLARKFCQIGTCNTKVNRKKKLVKICLNFFYVLKGLKVFKNLCIIETQKNLKSSIFFLSLLSIKKFA